MSFSDSYWVMRGFYPGISTMFKIVVADTSGGARESFYAKVSHPAIRASKGNPTQCRIDMKRWLSIMDDKANYILVGDDMPESKIQIIQRIPKCMSPKGVKIHNLKLATDKSKK
jgi:hypothetical protein